MAMTMLINFIKQTQNLKLPEIHTAVLSDSQ